MNPDIVMIMGAAGSGKTTVGRLLATELGWAFLDADDFHPAANIEKMSRGLPLDDGDRAPWLEAIRGRISACLEAQTPVVVACSALRKSYRNKLSVDPERMAWVYLKADRGLLERRLRERRGHYMKAGMLESQLAILEEPENAFIIDAGEPPEQIASAVRRHFLS